MWFPTIVNLKREGPMPRVGTSSVDAMQSLNHVCLFLERFMIFQRHHRHHRRQAL